MVHAETQTVDNSTPPQRLDPPADRDYDRILRDITRNVDSLFDVAGPPALFPPQSFDEQFYRAKALRSDDIWRLIDMMVRDKLDSLRADDLRNFAIHSGDSDLGDGAITPEELHKDFERFMD